MRILLVNPNTSTAATDAFLALARAAASPGTEIVGVTGRFGARLMRNAAETAIGTHAALEAIAEHGEGSDAVIVAAFGDYGVTAARAVFGVPVISIADAAFGALSLAGSRFAILTVNAAVAPVIARTAAEAGLGDKLAGIAFPDAAPGALGYAEAAAAAAKSLVEAHRPDVILAAGPPLAPLIAELRNAAGIPVIEGIACAVALAEALARIGFAPRGDAAIAGAMGDTAGFTGLSPRLTAALARAVPR